MRLRVSFFEFRNRVERNRTARNRIRLDEGARGWAENGRCETVAVFEFYQHAEALQQHNAAKYAADIGYVNWFAVLK